MPSQIANQSDFVILKKDNDYKHVQLLQHRQLSLFKEKFYLDGLIGQKFGSYFKVCKNQLVKVPHNELPNMEMFTDGDSEEKDNRQLRGSHDNQKLSKEDIQALRKLGTSGDQIVDQLVENSSTFQDKTEFSQRKYIRRKQKRHVFIVCMLPVTTRHIHEMYFNRGPSKLSYLRADTLAQILTAANIYAGSHVMVYETCSGIVLRAILERMGGLGRVVHLFSGTAPTRPTMFNNLALPGCSIDNVLYDFPVNRVAGLFADEEDIGNEGDIGRDLTDIAPTSDPIKKLGKRATSEDVEEEIEARNQRRQQRLQLIDQTKSLIQRRDTNALIIAGKVHPVALVTNLMEFLAPSSPIVIYCPYQEPLVECYQVLKGRGVLALKVRETFYRGYQFLKDRTHPHVLMSGNGGYLLTGIKVI